MSISSSAGLLRWPSELAIWAVRGRVLQWITDCVGTQLSLLSRSIRELYIDRNLPKSGMPQALLAGLMVARCRIVSARICVNGVSYDFAGPAKDPVDVPLLLQADDADWSAAMSFNPLSATPSIFLALATCLAGEIPFDRFTIHPDASPKQPDWRLQFGAIFNDPASKKAATTIRNVCLSSSGLGFDARAVLPWGGLIGKPQVSEARYLVEVQLSPQDNDPAVPAKSLPPEPPLLVLPDLERIDDARFAPVRDDYLAAFESLENLLSAMATSKTGPECPSGLASSSLTPTLSPASPGTSASRPGSKGFMTTFQFDPCAWLLTLTDQASGITDASPSRGSHLSPSAGHRTW